MRNGENAVMSRLNLSGQASPPCPPTWVIQSLWIRVQGVWVWGLRIRIQSSEFGIWGFGVRIQSLGFEVWDLRFRVQRFSFRV